MQSVRVFLLFPLIVFVSMLTACGGGGSSSSNSVTSSDLVVLASNNGLSVTQVDTTTGTPMGNLASVNMTLDVGSMVRTAQNLVYVSDIVTGLIYAYSLNTATGALTAVPGSPFSNVSGQSTQGLATDPAGKFLYATEPNGNQVAAFAIASTGALTEIAGSPFATGMLPVGAAVHPSGKYLYVANVGNSGGISGFTIDALGGLSPVPGSPFSVGGQGARRLLFHRNGEFLYTSASGGGGNQLYGDAIDTMTGILTPIAGSPSGCAAFPWDWRLIHRRSFSMLPVTAMASSLRLPWTLQLVISRLSPAARLRPPLSRRGRQ